ncbi:MAG: tRNA lysidine(34) synthetase TilS [Lachnospiraceae bacterium]|nr:tRNA lysidine(34) synthetase TilS [Lachnospiraceae bacterium]
MDLKQLVEEQIRAQGWIRPGDTVLCGVSGGADSLCLFHLLSAYKGEHSFAVMHVHHHLRDSADGDEAFVRELCKRCAVTYYRADVYLEPGASEEAARKARYAAFRDKLRELQPDPAHRKLAVAHTMDDDAETVLFRLFRGSGLKGLGGIRALQPMEDYTIFRPLLSVSRLQIEEYLNEKGFRWCSDETNAGDSYARNRIRHHILRTAAESVNPRAAEHIHGAAEQLKLAEDYLEDQAEACFASCTEDLPDGVHIDRKAFLALHPYMQRRLALTAMQKVSGREGDFSADHVLLFCGLFSLPTGKMLDLPGGLHATRSRTAVELLRKS